MAYKKRLSMTQLKKWILLILGDFDNIVSKTISILYDNNTYENICIWWFFEIQNMYHGPVQLIPMS